MDIHTIKEWFLSHRRSLPWRENPTPYRVWISEVMLQQTQVSVVIPYFERWMKVFPSIESLALASLEQVLKVWEGLGYYSRARHLHEAAQYIFSYHAGEMPSDPKALEKIKGLGPYTQGAIRSFAFHQKAPAVDGNVLRLISRFYIMGDPIDQPIGRKKITLIVEGLLPEEEPWVISEGFIELGATVCKKVPLCQLCPLKKGCLAFRHQKIGEFPKRAKYQETIILNRPVAVIRFENKWLIQKREKGKIMADLYEFPYLEKGENIKINFENSLGIQLEYKRPLSKQHHSFTRYRVHLFPHLLHAKELDARYEWKELERLKELPFSSGHRKILNELFRL